MERQGKGGGMHQALRIGGRGGLEIGVVRVYDRGLSASDRAVFVSPSG